MIGSVVDGRYRIVRQLGAGGMAQVFEATHTTTRRNVALKLVDLTLIDASKHEAFLARFGREARAAAAVVAPHIAQVLDAGRDTESGAPYLAMELLVGEDLRATLKRLGPLPEPVALKIALQACRALVVAHERGIVHRDIKPANLFLHQAADCGICVKLVDFGVAKLLDDRLVDPETSELTRTGTLLGTPHYMSPEQLLQTRETDHRSDLWSLGVVLYKLLSGETPFEHAASMALTVLAICAEPIPALGTRAPFIRKDVELLVQRCLERDPERRIGSATELLQALERLVDGDRIRADELVGLDPELRARVQSSSQSIASDTGAVLRNDAETTALTLSSEREPRDPATSRARAAPKWIALGLVAAVLGLGVAFGVIRSEPPRSLESVLGRHELPRPAATTAPAKVVEEAAAPSVSRAITTSERPLTPGIATKPPAPSATPKASGVGLRDEFD